MNKRTTPSKGPDRATSAGGAAAAAATARQEPTYEEIAQLAYQLWLDGGRQEGLDIENWLRAEAMLRGEVVAAA